MSERPAAGPSGPSGAWRVGDRDRDAAAAALGEHYATGRLDRREHDERTDLAYAARTASDLRALFVDLPLPHGSVTPAPAQAPAPAAGPRPRPGRPRSARPRHHRGPVGPWLLLAVPIVVLTGAWWLLWLVPVLLWCVVRPARRHAAPRARAHPRAADWSRRGAAHW